MPMLGKHRYFAWVMHAALLGCGSAKSVKNLVAKGWMEGRPGNSKREKPPLKPNVFESGGSHSNSFGNVTFDTCLFLTPLSQRQCSATIAIIPIVVGRLSTLKFQDGFWGTNMNMLLAPGDVLPSNRP